MSLHFTDKKTETPSHTLKQSWNRSRSPGGQARTQIGMHWQRCKFIVLLWRKAAGWAHHSGPWRFLSCGRFSVVGIRQWGASMEPGEEPGDTVRRDDKWWLGTTSGPEKCHSGNYFQANRNGSGHGELNSHVRTVQQRRLYRKRKGV